MLEEGKSPSTLRGMVAAIKAARVGPQKLAEGCCNLIAQFLKGARRVTPYHRRPAVPPWDLEVVQSALQHEPFEPLETNGLKRLSLKSAFLLTIVSAKRMGELHTLWVHAECCRFLPCDAGVVLRPNPAFHPKVLSESDVSQTIKLHPFHPPQDSETELSGQSLLCPIRALMVYLHRTHAHRTTDQLFVCYKPNCLRKPVNKTRLSHWVVDAIRQAYKMAGRQASEGVWAHSMRGLATYHGPYGGVPLYLRFVRQPLGRPRPPRSTVWTWQSVPHSLNMCLAQCSRMWPELPPHRVKLLLVAMLHTDRTNFLMIPNAPEPITFKFKLKALLFSCAFDRLVSLLHFYFLCCI